MQAGKPKDYFEDCELGETMGSRGRTLAEADIHQFAEFAAKGLFGERIAGRPQPGESSL